MPLNPTYSVGTASVSAGSAVVSFTGTQLIATGVRPGDVFERGGLTVSIDTVDSPTQLTLVKAWPGTTGSGSYEVRFTSDASRVLANTRQAIDLFETIEAMPTQSRYADVQGWLSSGLAWLQSLPDQEYRITSGLSIPSGTRITGHLRLVTSMTSGVMLSIGSNVTIDQMTIRYDGVVPTAATVPIGRDFKCRELRASSPVETGNSFLTIDNTGLDIDLLETTGITRPITIGLNGAIPTIGGRVRTMIVNTFIRGLAVNHAYGFTVDTFIARGRAAAATKSPGHNGILLSGASGLVIGKAYIDGAAEHAFRVGGSPVGGKSNDCQIGSLITANTGGSPFKANDNTALCENWTIGSIMALGSLGAAPGRNSELLRLSHVKNFYIGSATARRNGGTYSVSGGLHVADATDVHVGVLDLEDYLTEAVAVRDQDDSFDRPVSRITVGYLRAVGSTNPILALASAAPVTDIQIADGYFDTTSANLVAADTFAVINSPIEIAGYLKGGGEGVSGPAAANTNARIRRPNGSATFGRGLTAGGDLGVSSRPFNPGNVSQASFGGIHVVAQGVTAATGALGAGFSASRPGAPGRRGMAMVPFQDGSAANNVGVGLYAGSNATATDELRNQWQFRYNGNLDFRNPSSGPVILSPNGTRYRIAVSDGGALSAISA